MLDLFKITKDYFYTPIIIVANVIIWIAMVAVGVDAFEPSVDDLLNWGGNLSAITLNGQPWRLFTSTFLHGGFFHIMLNMYALLQVGHLLETHFGKHRYALVYLVTGIFASIASAAFNENIVSVGASGAIFGLYGLLLSMLITKSLKISAEERQALLISTLTFIGYNVLFGFAKSGIDNAAHIGGLLSGFVIGFVYYPALGKQGMSAGISVLLIVLTAAAVWIAPKVIVNPYAQYDAALQGFGDREEAAMWMYKVDFPAAGTEEAARFKERLKTEGINLWEENLSKLNALQDMPESLQKRVDLLKEYCRLRIESCKIMQLLTEEESVENLQRVSEINEQIDSVIKKLEALNK